MLSRRAGQSPTVTGSTPSMIRGNVDGLMGGDGTGIGTGIDRARHLPPLDTGGRVFIGYLLIFLSFIYR
jgi:hypothetical protein